MWFLFLLVLLLAIASLESTFAALKDIRTGRPHINNIRDVTDIIDKEEINRRFGMPDAEERYFISPEQIKALKKCGMYAAIGDALCIAFLATALVSDLPLIQFFAWLSALYQIIGWAHALYWGWKYRSQLFL